MPKYTDTRRYARQEILAAANLHRRLKMRARFRHGFLLPPLTMKDLQHAVHICRVNFLVSDNLLRAAGFGPKKYYGLMRANREATERELEAIELGEEWDVA